MLLWPTAHRATPRHDVEHARPCAAHMILSRVAGGTQGSTIGMVNPAYLSYSKALKFDSWVTLGTMLTHE